MARLSTAAMLALLLGAAVLPHAEARINATGALATFLITECAECTKDKDSIFCSEASSESNFVSNATFSVNIRQKKALFGAADGAK
jgi:hypothetical protein